jgi:large subunit ribosomal protein L23
VDEKASKQEIKKALEEMFSVKVEQVRTLNDSKGRKRAYVKFSSETPAIDLATKLGLM